METESEGEKLGVFPFIVSGFSYIPLLGVPLGILLVIWGLASRKKNGKLLALIGLGGVLTTFIVYGSLFFAAFHGGVFDKLGREQAAQNLAGAVQSIEYYKIQHGAYPDSIEQLVKSFPSQAQQLVLMDMSRPLMKRAQQPYFYYQKLDEGHYYLLGVGEDGLPFTADDVVPVIAANERTGLVVRPASQLPAAAKMSK